MEVENFAQAIVDNIFDQKNASSDVDDVSDFGVLNSVVSAAEMAVAAVLPLNSVSELESFDESNFECELSLEILFLVRVFSKF